MRWLAALLAIAAPASALADWQVRRRGGEALRAEAERALRQRPDDTRLAERLIRLAGKAGVRKLVEGCERADDAAPRRYQLAASCAQILLLAGQPAEAAVRFAVAATLRPRAPAPLLGRGRALAAAGRRAEAAMAYEAAVALARTPAETRRTLDEIALRALDPTDTGQAVALRSRLRDLDPGNDRRSEDLAGALERAGRPAEAAAAIEPLLSRAGSDARRTSLALRAADLFAAAGQDERASTVVDALLERLPARERELRRQAWGSAIDIGRRRDGLTALAARIERVPKLGLADLEALARIRDELGDADGALAAMRRAFPLAPDDVAVRLRAISVAERLGREDEVAATYEALARRRPGDPRFPVELIERRFRRGERDEARARLDAALTRFARNPAGLAALADLATRWSEDARALGAWQRLRRLAPRDEAAILGLGEAHFQRGRKDLALATWHELGRDGRANGRARLAQILLDHDLFDEAMQEARAAAEAEPRNVRHKRTLAQILERQKKPDAAVKLWQGVLEASDGPERATDRREARARILALLAKQGGGRLDELALRLEEELKRNPGDREAALFLAEARLRARDPGRAIIPLRAAVERDPGDAEMVLAVVRLLRLTRQTDEAVRLLDELARRTPARARDAHVQMADIALGKYDDRLALEHARAAAALAPDDPQVLARMAEVEERSGQPERAIASYRRALAAGGGPPAAAFALARLLVRRGSATEAAEVLRRVLRETGDEETVADAARRAIDLEEYLGTLPDLERTVAGLAFSGTATAAHRRALVEILRRMVPALYVSAPADENAALTLAAIGRHGLRPLLEAVTDPDVEPNRTLIETLGMLGNGDGAPALARLCTHKSRELRIASAIALGRLADPRGREALEALAASEDADLRATAVWGLGRIGSPESVPLLVREIDEPNDDVRSLACLSLGRLRDPRGTPGLLRVVTDVSGASRRRRAAALGLGWSGDPDVSATLLSLLDSGDGDLAVAAGAALGQLRDRRTVPALLERALLPRGPASGGAAALAALDRMAIETPLPDEARAVGGNRLVIDALLGALTAPAPRADRTPMWIDRGRELGALLAGALDRHRDLRIRALAALDARSDGPGLGVLAPEGGPPPSPQAAATLREVGAALRDRVVALIGDADPETRRLALRVSAKLGDERAGVEAVAAALLPADSSGAPDAGLVESAALAAGLRARIDPSLARALIDRIGPLAVDASSAWERRLGAVRVLAAVGAPACDPLAAALGDGSSMVRAEAARALRSLGTAEATPALERAARDPSPAVRAAAGPPSGP